MLTVGMAYGDILGRNQHAEHDVLRDTGVHWRYWYWLVIGCTGSIPDNAVMTFGVHYHKAYKAHVERGRRSAGRLTSSH